MNDDRFPHPNGHEDTDLRPDRRADASMTDADALDALLNEIAQGNGAPNPRTRAGDSHQRMRPDVRTEAGGANSLPAAARAFHRRVETAERRAPGFEALDPHLWETIMTASSPAATGAEPVRGALPRQGAHPTRVPPPTRSRNPVPDRHPPGRWARVANATLALIILLAGFGVWRVYDGMNATGPTNPDGRIPGLAMPPETQGSPGTPGALEPTEPSVVAAPPAATPAPITACDFGADIPIFPGVDASPINGTALLLTTTGDLVLACPEEPDPVVLATGVDQASSLTWPGIVTLIGEVDGGAQPLSVLNVITGENVKVGVPPDAMRYELNQSKGSPWLVAPAGANPQDWAITDLRTMESRLLSAYAATAIPENTSIFTSANANGGLVIGVRPPNDADGQVEPMPGGLLGDAGLPGSLLVVEGVLDTAHWIEVPDDLPFIRELSLAPDGRHLAFRRTEHEFEEREVEYSIVRTSDGGQVARSEVVRPSEPIYGMRWVQGGNALAYTSHTRLRLLSITPGAEPVTLLQSDAALGELGATYDPDVVIVHRVQAEEVATETPNLVQPRIYSVDTASGEAIEIDGVDVSKHVSPWEPDTRFLVMGDTDIQHMDAETATFQVVDAVSGEVLDELTDVQISQDPNGPMMGLRSVVSTDDGRIEVIGFGASQLFVLREADGNLEIRTLPSPNPDIESYIASAPIWLSDDGAQLSLTMDNDESGTRYLINLTDSDAAWLAVSSSNVEPGYGPDYIVFIPGTGD